jgi:type II secretory ATPase GspE/PulE/Tfp pilus assembly ATPase PilB-like protein
MAENLGLPPGNPVWNPIGCVQCANTGYKGRLVLCEIFKPDEDVKNGIFQGVSPLELENMAQRQKPDTLVPIWCDGLERVLKGDTSIDEVLRVLVGVSSTQQPGPSGARR